MNQQVDKSINSTPEETNIAYRLPQAPFSLGNWIYIHRYPINTEGGDQQQKTAILVSLTDEQLKALEREQKELKNLVDNLKDDLDKAASGEEANETTKTLKENALTALKTLGVMDSDAGKDETGLDMAEYLNIAKQELCFARQSTLQAIVDRNQHRIITVKLDANQGIAEAFKAAIKSFAIKKEGSFNVKTEGALTEFYQPLDKWFKNIEESLSGSANGANAFFAYEANITTVFLRYMAGASGSAGFELGPDKLEAFVTGEAKASIDLVKCSADANLYIPSKEGMELKIPPVPAEWQENPTLKLSDQFRKTNGVLRNEPEPDDAFPYVNSFPKIHFDFDSSFIRPDQLDKFVQLEKTINSNPAFKVQIVGHTDLVGSEKYNMSLSERRARAAYAYIQNDADFWEALYSDLEPKEWGLPVLRSILLTLLSNRQHKMNARQQAEYQQILALKKQMDVKQKDTMKAMPAQYLEGSQRQLAFKLKTPYTLTTEPEPSADDFTYGFQKALKIYTELYFCSGRFSIDKNNKALRLQMFSDYMRLNGDIFLTRGRFHKSKLMFLGESNPVVQTKKREARNRRVEFWLYEVCDTNEDFANFGACRIHLTGELSGWAGASACAAIDLDAKVDLAEITGKDGERKESNELILQGTPRTEKTEENEVGQLTIEQSNNSDTKTDNSTKTDVAEGANHWGLTTEKKQSEETVTTSRQSITSENYQSETKKTKTESTQASQSKSYFWDSENNALTTERKRDTRSDKKVEWRSQKTRKVKNVLPDGVVGAGAEGSLSAFAGAKAEAKGSIALEWSSQEVSTNNSVATYQAKAGENIEPFEKANDGFLELAKAGAGVEGWAGIGAEVDFAIRLHNDQLLVRTKMAGAVGLGAGVAVDMSVSPFNIYNMLAFIYDQLRKADYKFLDYITQEAWQWIQYGFTKYLQYGKEAFQYAIEQGLEAGELLVDQAWEIGEAVKGKIDEKMDDIRTWWRVYEQRSDEIKQIAQNIIKNPHGLRFAPPDVKARLMTDLLEAYKKIGLLDDIKGVDEIIEDAILCILQWVQSKREFEKVMQRVGVEAPVRPDPDNKAMQYWIGSVFNRQLYAMALDNYNKEKLVNAEKQKEEIVSVLDWSQDTKYFIWLNNYLPDSAPKSNQIKPNEFLNKYCSTL